MDAPAEQAGVFISMKRELPRSAPNEYCIVQTAMMRILATGEFMANQKQKTAGGKIPGVPKKENPGHSTKETPGITGNRTTTERRLGSGNTRRGAAAARKSAGA
jgi:hypothetical protein